MARKPVQTEGWRNRIVGEDSVDPATLMPNSSNWRIHGQLQSDALAGVLSDVGWVQRILVNRRSNTVVDGHLRLKLALDRHEPSVPVLYVDLSEEEERLVLLTLDPLSAMAQADKTQLAALMQDVQHGDAAVQQMLRELAEAQGIVPGTEALTDVPGLGEDTFGGDDTPLTQSLVDRFGAPPFSVFDARQGYWQERKRAWLALGIQSELGRGDVMPSGATGVYAGGSPWSGKRGGGKPRGEPQTRDEAS